MSTRHPIRQFEVEELAAEWTSGRRRDELLAELAREPGGTERLAEISRSNEEILSQYPPRQIAAQITRRLRETDRTARSRLRFALPAVAAVGAAVALAWVLLPLGVRHGGDMRAADAVSEEHLLVKGAPQLIIHLRNGDEVRRLRSGQEAFAGDLLQLEYNAAEARYGVILSVDGRGSVTLHLPAEPGGSTALLAGGARALPFSYELDDAPGFERFFLVWSQRPIPVEAVLSAAEKSGASQTARLDLPEGLESEEFLLLKRPSRRRP
jgi:hypothetical protein